MRAGGPARGGPCRAKAPHNGSRCAPTALPHPLLYKVDSCDMSTEEREKEEREEREKEERRRLDFDNSWNKATWRA